MADTGPSQRVCLPPLTSRQGMSRQAIRVVGETVTATGSRSARYVRLLHDGGATHVDVRCHPAPLTLQGIATRLHGRQALAAQMIHPTRPLRSR